MTFEYGVVLDTRLVQKRYSTCLGKKLRMPVKNLFLHLEENPRLAIITDTTEKYIEERLWKPVKNSSQKAVQLLSEFDLMKDKFLRTETVNYDGFKNKLESVNKLFNNLISPEEPSFISETYRYLFQKNEYTPFSTVDKESLAEAASLKHKYETLLFASKNNRFSQPFVVNAVEENLDVIPGGASFILEEMTKIMKK